MNTAEYEQGWIASVGAVKLSAAQIEEEAAREKMRPCVIFAPKLFPDGDMWCALFGENLQEGVSGFGKTPCAAMANFDHQWLVAKAGVPSKMRHTNEVSDEQDAG